MSFGLKLCFIVLTFTLLQEGQSLKCYHCISPGKGYCDNPLDARKASIQYCSSHHVSCAVLTVTGNGVSEVRRECAEANYCSQTRKRRQANSYAHACSTCSGNLCNSSPNLAPSFGFGIGGFILAKYFYL